MTVHLNRVNLRLSRIKRYYRVLWFIEKKTLHVYKKYRDKLKFVLINFLFFFYNIATLCEWHACGAVVAEMFTVV